VEITANINKMKILFVHYLKSLRDGARHLEALHQIINKAFKPVNNNTLPEVITVSHKEGIDEFLFDNTL
jgi:hypothetical protein